MRRMLLCAIVLTVAGCGGGGGGATQASTEPRPTRGRADLIAEAEINSALYQNALEIVQNLRPAMLIPRGTSPTARESSTASIAIVAYQDDVRLGEISSLVNIPASRVKEIRFLNARDATTRYGTGHGSGVILVTTKR
jgi:hypothetical protein